MSSDEESGHNPNETGYDCALCEEPNHADGNMVYCRRCSRWFHFKCAKVTEAVKDMTWSCEDCRHVGGASNVTESIVEVTNSTGDAKSPDAVGPKSPSQTTTEDRVQDEGSDKQDEADVQLQRELEQMRKNFLRQMQRENEKRMMQLALEREMLQMRKDAEAEFRKQRIELYKEFQFEDAPLDGEENAIGGVSEQNREPALAEMARVWTDNQPITAGQNKPVHDIRGAYPKNSTPNNATRLGNIRNTEQPFPSILEDETPLRNPQLPFTKVDKPAVQPLPVNRLNNPQVSNAFRSFAIPPGAPVVFRSQLDQPSQHLPVPEAEPELTKSQIAARKGPFSKLPIFTGRPEEWPLFVSSFNNGNRACNWSNLENLGRLQESIKGPALEAVRSRLLLPESVPQVIETLRRLYGRPEQLLHSLMQKARKAESPRVDRLASFISYGMVVQQLCDHLVASGLVDHLVNPMLITELVEKLPPSTKLEWVRYKRQQNAVTLSTFSDFLSGIVSEASEVTLYMDSTTEARSNRNRKEKQRNDKNEGFLNTHVGIEQSSHQPKGLQKSDGQFPSRKPCRGCDRTDHRTRFCDEFKKLALEERIKIAEKWKLCQLCLNEHGQSRCRFKNHCSVGDCKDRHHPLLHPSDPVATLSTSCNVHNSDQHPVIFRMVPIKLHNGKRTLDVIAFLDEGSSYSLIESSVAEEMKLGGLWRPILVKWTAGMSRLERDSRCVNVSVSAKGSNEKLLLRNVHTVQQLQLPEQRIKFAEITARFKHLKGLPVADCQNGPPRILIGLKHLHVYAPLESRVGQPGEPIGVRTRLGWTIYGPQGNAEESVGFAGHHTSGELTDQALHELLRRHFTLEESGVSVTVLPESAEDRRAREMLEKTTVRVGERFESGLLWKDDHPQLPDSFPMALKRMKNLERKLVNNPELRENVEKQIEEYQRKGYAHVATPEELAAAESGRVWYLPLNVVQHPKKPGKIRLVWDAAACVQGKSLNSELLKGPDLLTSLPTVICHFRERPVAFGGDIMEMYHQVQIRPNDRSAQRFLFRPNGSGPPIVFTMDVATFGSTCSPSTAQYVKNYNAKEFADQFPDAVEAIIKKHYVDDYFDSTETVEQAITRAREVAFIHAKAGFKIRNWVSNSFEFLRHFGENDAGQVIHFNSDKITGTERVLGMSWDTVNDVFQFSTKFRDDLEPFMMGERQPSKRNALSCIMSFFDPLGLLALYVVHGKMIIQGLWRNGCSWDQTIDGESLKKWSRWIALLPQVEAMRIPRCYFSSADPLDYDNLQLHVFTDASEDAFGCVAYFRILVKGRPRCALVSAKSKVAPLQHLSIPRLELQAAVLGSRLAATVKENHSLEVKQLFLWTDSRTVLSWIRSDHKRYKQFVAHRIGEILSITSVGDWRWVPTKSNVADVLTKWANGPPLESNGRWVNGPEFLYHPEEEWPLSEMPAPNVEEELRAYFLLHEISFSTSIIDTTRFSRWNRLVRCVNCVFRFISNCRRKKRGLPIETLRVPAKMSQLVRASIPAVQLPFVSEEYLNAENYLWRMAQQDEFGDEVKTLLKNRQLPQHKQHSIDRNSVLYKLSPFLDDAGVIRMEGRTVQADFIPFEQRCPIVLPKGHDITTKLLAHYHHNFGHANRETVVNEIRQRFFIQNLRAAVLQVIKGCAWCKVHKCRPTFPRMAPLPVHRITPQLRPFSFVGVDYFGPVTVSVGRRSEKRWICLFTCLVTRAIHMEVAHSLSSQSCIMAIRRFSCRRGAPKHFFSDNGTNFQAASKEIIGDVRQIVLECAEVFTDARTRWSFNPPSAPHMGGSWERLVRSAKEAMKALHDGRKLSDEILLTVLAEAEDMVNSRPLTYVPQESAEIEALTPNHFLRGLPAGEREVVNMPTSSAEALRDNYKRSQELADMLWKRWLKEYIPTVNLRTKWHEEQEAIREGELVYIADGNNRRTWIRGIVEKLIRGIDGRVRQVMVRTAKGLYRRPVAKLAVMELRSKSGRIPGPEPELREGEMLPPNA